MKVLVTGGAGFIGSVTVSELVEKGYDVVVYDSLEKGHKEALPKNVELVQGNLNNLELLNKTFKKHNFDVVIHFAGYIEAGESMKQPLKFFENNVINSINLLNVMIKNDVKKIVYSSSAAVYGNPAKIPIKEDAELKPVNYYGLTKLMVEQIIDSCKVYGIKSIALRYFNASGATDNLGEAHDPETHLIPLILKVALNKIDKVRVFGTDYETEDGTCIRDYIHVLDLADAHILALEYLNKSIEGKYNVGTGKGYSVKQVLEVCREVTKKEILFIEAERRKGDPSILIASPEKIENELKWKAKFDLKDIIKSVWEWHENNPNGYEK